MNPSIILAMILELYEQLLAAQNRIAELESQLSNLNNKEGPVHA